MLVMPNLAMLARACQHRPFFDTGKGLPAPLYFFMALNVNMGYCHIVVHSHTVYHFTLIPGGVAPPLAAPPSFYQLGTILGLSLFANRKGTIPLAGLRDLNRRYPEKPFMEPQKEGDIKSQADDNGNPVIEFRRRRTGDLARLPLAHRQQISKHPQQEGAEQYQIRKCTVGKQVGRGPEFGGQQHRMFDGRLDPTRHIGADQ